MLNKLSQGWYLFASDFQHRYRLTLLGWIWSVVKPLASVAPIIFVGKHLNLSESTDIPYEVFALAGAMFWNVFWDSVQQTLFYARRYRKTLCQYPVSAGALIAAGGIGALFNLVLSFPLVLIFCIQMGVHLPAAAALSLLCIPVLILAGSTVALPLVSASFIFHDVLYGIGFIGQLALWSVPVLYSMPDSGPLYWVNLYNPLTYAVSVPRDLLLRGDGSLAPEFASFAILTLFAFALSLWFYRASSRSALDYVI